METTGTNAIVALSQYHYDVHNKVGKYRIVQHDDGSFSSVQVTKGQLIWNAFISIFGQGDAQLTRLSHGGDSSSAEIVAALTHAVTEAILQGARGSTIRSAQEGLNHLSIRLLDHSVDHDIQPLMSKLKAESLKKPAATAGNRRRRTTRRFGTATAGAAMSTTGSAPTRRRGYTKLVAPPPVESATTAAASSPADVHARIRAQASVQSRAYVDALSEQRTTQSVTRTVYGNKDLTEAQKQLFLRAKAKEHPEYYQDARTRTLRPTKEFTFVAEFCAAGIILRLKDNKITDNRIFQSGQNAAHNDTLFKHGTIPRYREVMTAQTSTRRDHLSLLTAHMEAMGITREA